MFKNLQIDTSEKKIYY